VRIELFNVFREPDNLTVLREVKAGDVPLPFETGEKPREAFFKERPFF